MENLPTTSISVSICVAIFFFFIHMAQISANNHEAASIYSHGFTKNYTHASFYRGLHNGEIRAVRQSGAGAVVAWVSDGRGYTALVSQYNIADIPVPADPNAAAAKVPSQGLSGSGYNAVAPNGSTLRLMNTQPHRKDSGRAVSVRYPPILTIIYLNPTGLRLPDATPAAGKHFPNAP